MDQAPGGMKTVLIVVLAVALAAAIAAGLLGLWPDLRGKSDSTKSERSEKLRIAAVVGQYMPGWEVQRVYPDYVPHRALVQILNRFNNTAQCVIAAQNYGSHFDSGDLEGPVPCDL